MADVLLLLLVLGLIAAACGLWVAAIAGSVDAMRRPAEVWAHTGARKRVWVWQALFVWCLPIILIYSGWYFLRVRPPLRAAERRLGIGIVSYQSVDAGGVLASGLPRPAGDPASERTVKLRAHPAYQFLGFAPPVVFVILATLLSRHADRSRALPLLTEGLLVAIVVGVPGAWFGVNLTPEGIVVNNLRRRRIPWAEIAAVTQEPFVGGRRVVLWTRSGLRVPLRVPSVDMTGIGRRRFEAGYEAIGQRWLAHNAAR